MLANLERVIESGKHARCWTKCADFRPKTRAIDANDARGSRCTADSRRDA
jgi:hypothetical protein